MAADQFDLVCKAKGEAARFRVDLIRGEWCLENCLIVMPIVRSTSEELVFADHAEAYRGDYTAYNGVNRVTGAWKWYSYGPGNSQSITGSCEVAPFTVMPTPTKF